MTAPPFSAASAAGPDTAYKPPSPVASSFPAYPALRVNNQPDSLDGQRIALVRDRWAAQDAVRLPFERQVEEHCRLLAGRQWDIWSEALGRFVDVSTLFSDEEKLWRQRPVVNYLAYWFMLTHARLTENPPIITFQPATSDRRDAMLAETLDTVQKTVWNDAHANEGIDRVMAWVVAAGTAYAKSYPDLAKGTPSPRIGPATATIPHPETGEPMELELAEPVPYSADGEPQFEVQQDPETMAYHAVPTAEVEYEPDGQVCLAVLNPIQVRGEWNAKPWDEKLWHTHRDYYRVDEVKARWKVDVPPDTKSGMPGTGQSSTPGYLERLLFGGGYYGTAERGGGSTGISGSSDATGVSGSSATDPGWVVVDEYWEKPSPLNEQQGRHLIVTQTKVLYDGPNPFPKLKGPSPIRRFEFVGLPGRPAGTTPMEFLVPLQRQLNRFWAQAMEHGQLMTNPAILADDAAGLDDEQFTMMPGMILHGGLRNGQPMVAPFQPPPLSKDFWQIQEMVRESLMFLGNLAGTEGTAPTEDSSGELVAQLRANSDRFVGPTARQMVTEIARMAEDWTAILSVIWTKPKLLLVAGEDNIPQTIAVEPELWSGNVNAVPDVQSMLPESRDAKQSRIMNGFTNGLFGPPLDPKVAETVRGMLQFPNMNRAMQPGGVDGATANQALGKVILGADPNTIPFFEPYKMDVWLDVIGKYIAAPEFLQNTPETQQAVVALYERAKQFAQLQMVSQAAQAAQVQTGVMTATVQNNPMAAVAMHSQAAQQMNAANPPQPSPSKGDGPPSHPGPATPSDVGKAAPQRPSPAPLPPA